MLFWILMEIKIIKNCTYTVLMKFLNLPHEEWQESVCSTTGRVVFLYSSWSSLQLTSFPSMKLSAWGTTHLARWATILSEPHSSWTLSAGIKQLWPLPPSSQQSLGHEHTPFIPESFQIKIKFFFRFQNELTVTLTGVLCEDHRS